MRSRLAACISSSKKKKRKKGNGSLSPCKWRNIAVVLLSLYMYTLLFFFFKEGGSASELGFPFTVIAHTHTQKAENKKKTNTHDFGIGIRTYICACSSHCQPDRSHLSSFSFEYRLFLLFLYLSHALQRYMCMHWKKKKNKRHSFHNFAQSVFFSFVTFFFLQLTRVRFFPSQSCEFAAETVFFFFLITPVSRPGESPVFFCFDTHTHTQRLGTACCLERRLRGALRRWRSPRLPPS